MAKGCHREKLIGRHYSNVNRPISTKFGEPMHTEIPMTIYKSMSKPEVEFRHSGVCLFKGKVVIYKLWIEISVEIWRINLLHEYRHQTKPKSRF